MLGLFGKSRRERETEAALKRAHIEDLEVFSGMRVEVTVEDSKLFLMAVLVGLRGDRAYLKPLSDSSLMLRSDGPFEVTMRGFSGQANTAVVLEGTIRPGSNGMWQVEHLALMKAGNDRAFFRMPTSINATMTPLDKWGGSSEGCKLVNISVGGVCVSAQTRHNVGNRFILRVRLMPELEPSLLMCQILRINERRHGYFEYGCCFLNLKESDQEQIFRIIFDMQRKERNKLQ